MNIEISELKTCCQGNLELLEESNYCSTCGEPLKQGAHHRARVNACSVGCPKCFFVAAFRRAEYKQATYCPNCGKKTSELRFPEEEKGEDPADLFEIAGQAKEEEEAASGDGPDNLW